MLSLRDVKKGRHVNASCTLHLQRKMRPLTAFSSYNDLRITYPMINVTNDIKKTTYQTIEADSYKTSTAYVLKTNKALRDSTNFNPLDNNAKQPSIIEVNEPDEGENEGEEDEQGIRGRLMESLTNKLNGKPYNPITYIAQDKHNLAHLLSQETSDNSRIKKVCSADLELWKLAVSSTINFMHPIFEVRLSKLFTEQQLDTTKGHMNDQKKVSQNTKNDY
ncbi:uncharacterized protein BX663DRAFT_484435 [Cokeromyces recurvatus]|uniref:uncharacterized protein n=1 Tax=Cokeromyces recurvatus TaxID=90255 RepID=UPI002220C726|nr:uncharacterized protein BX663DRAFT_484435 [Cokeromyces recurvatus]KAI7905111.1 hypothetical protein BX663DRAFT_484435 [Cokeromyces recurvatus]